MKPSAVPLATNYNGAAPAAKINFEIPQLSAKLSQLPQLLTQESYKTYIQQLNTDISNAIKPGEKRKADEYIKNKKLTRSKDISNTALAVWLQKAPCASLYLYSKAVITNPSDILAANNFSAFLLMGGLPEKSIPILEYWNKQKPGEATVLSNLGNAYYRLGDADKAMSYLLQCVQKDTLNATANKILCLLYLKKGDTKKAEDHGIKSVITSHDQQVISVLRQLNKQVKPGEIMSRAHKKEFPLLKRTRLPAMPSSLDEMDMFIAELETEKKSVNITIESIEAKMPQAGNELQKMRMAGLTGGISLLRAKAQFIIMDAMQLYQEQKIMESDVYKYHLKMLTGPYNIKVKAISKKYADKLNKLEGGEAGDEDEIAALEMTRCKEINAETGKYLAELSPLVNEYAQRQEVISRKFYRDYANWAPYWMPQAANSFISIERDYLKDISSILSEYKTVTKSQCVINEEKPTSTKNAVLKEWDDEYCANFKGKLGLGPVEITWACNSWGVEGGEGLVGEFEMNYATDGSFEGFSLGGGFGETWNLGGGDIVMLEAGASVKEFIKIGSNKATGKWEVTDFGIKTEASLEGGIGPVSTEVKILELSGAVNAGFEAGGVMAPVLHLK
jgi:tetratricopeptide (TPR) repeat protein